MFGLLFIFGWKEREKHESKTRNECAIDYSLQYTSALNSLSVDWAWEEGEAIGKIMDSAFVSIFELFFLLVDEPGHYCQSVFFFSI